MILPVCFPALQVPSEKGSTLKRKNLLPKRANSFLLEKSLFQEGGQTNLILASPESVLVCLNLTEDPDEKKKKKSFRFKNICKFVVCLLYLP